MKPDLVRQGQHFHLCGRTGCTSEQLCTGPQPCGIAPGTPGDRLCRNCIAEIESEARPELS